MHLACPHCRNPIEVVEETPPEEVLCPSCGSSFRVARGSTAAWMPPPGQRDIGKFELLGIVGTGAFGTVYKARDTELDRVVALKIPRAGNLSTPQERDRFLREARSAAQLHHPSIVPVHEVGQHDGLPFLVSDFVEGITLADELSAQRTTPADAARLVAAVADALHYAHGCGVVHRDVKPSNIILSGDGSPHVMDFGLAKREAGEITVTLDGQVLGTPAYMSPEQARGEAHRVDGRSDVYSLGVILYQFLTGELPFKGTSRMLLHQVLHDEPRPPRKLNRQIPKDLETICMKAMAKEPGRRYATAAELAADLRRFLANEPILARRTPLVERGFKWVKRRPAAAALAALIVVAASVAILFWQEAEAARQQREADAEAAAEARREKIEYYASFVRRWGLPEGIGRLTSEQARRRGVTYKFYRRGGRVEKLEVVNGHDRLTSFDPESLGVVKLDILGGSGGDAPCRFEYRRDEQGRLAREIAFDRRGEVAWSFVYATPDTAHYLDKYGYALTRVGSGAAYVEFTWSPEGFPTEIHYLDGNRQRRPDQNGVYGIRQQFDRRGLPLRKTFLDRNDRPMMAKELYAQDVKIYDDQGNWTRWTCLGANGEPVRNSNFRIHAATHKHDAVGNVIECAHYGVDGKPCPDYQGAYTIVFTFDDHGDRTETTYLGLDGKPTLTTQGNAGLRMTFDDHGNAITWTHCAIDGLPTSAKYGVARAVYTFDDRDQRTSYSGFDEAGKPAANPGGVWKVTWSYDKRGNMTEMAYFGLDGKPMPRGIARVTMAHDRRNNVVKRAFWDAKSKAMIHPSYGVHQLTWEYDDRGNATAGAAWGLDGKAALLHMGYAKWTYKYDDRGYLVETVYLGLDGRPTRTTSGYARVLYDRDNHGRTIGESLFDPDDKPITNINGFHKSVRRYDDQGNEVLFAGIGVNGKPCLGKDGYAKSIHIYDQHRNLIKTAYFGLDDKPVLDRTHGYAWCTWTYDRFNACTDVKHYDMAGKQVATKVFVARVSPGSVGALAGLRMGDRVVRYGGKEVINTARLKRAQEAARRDGKPRPLELRRDGKPVRLSVGPDFDYVELEDRVPPRNK